MRGYRAHLCVLCALVAALVSGAHGTLFHVLTDARFSWFPRTATSDVVLIAIDPPSIKEIGVWPWPRTLHADLLNRLERAGTADIVFDIDFSSRQNDAADAAFLEALKQAKGSVVLPSFMQRTRDAQGIFASMLTRPLPEFRKSTWPATANVMAESDGLVRGYALGATLEGEFVPSIGALLAGVYDARGSEFLIDFSIRTESIPVISYIDILDGTVPAQQIKGKKVIVGATAVELGDRFNVPNGHVIPGPTLQAVAAESLLQGRALMRTNALVAAVGLAVLASISLLIWRRTSTFLRISLLASSAAGIELLATVLQVKWGLLLDTSLWHVAIAAYLSMIGLEEMDVRGLMAKIAEKRFRRIAMSLGDGLICTDSNDVITFWNPAATQIFGYEREETLGQPFQTLLASTSAMNLADRNATFPDGAEDTASRIVELEGRRKSGESFALEASISRWKHTDAFHYGFVLRDISVRKREQERIRLLAEHDVLTGLANRSKLNDELAHILATAGSARQQVAVILLGLDHFKDLNDALGQDRGDKVVCAVANKLRDRLSSQGLVARVSGDEFAVTLALAETAPPACVAVDAVTREFASITIEFDDRTVTIAVSLGSAVFPRDAGTANELLANASLALQDAKLHCRGGHVAYRPELRAKIEAGRRLEKDLILAFERDEFELFYQPQVDLRERRVIGAEALIRWRHPRRGLISPGEFIPVLNTMPLSANVAHWVIKTACMQAGEWHRAGHDVRVGINLAESLFANSALPDIVADAMQAASVPACLIELEVTENILLEDKDNAADMLRKIREAGVAVAFDDFGTGYASLTYLKRFPLDRLKIDQTFVRDMLKNQNDRSIVGAVVGLGKLLNMHLIAEGVEDCDTAHALMEMGCTEGQGYHFGRPVPAAEFAEMYLLDPKTRPQPDIAPCEATRAA